MRTAELREKYLSFFEGKGHLRLPSFSLIPEDDPSILFTSAGMAPLKPYFLGARPVFGGKEWRRVTTCQKCLRVGDIENVGRTGRHNTFFEMLGNFSFGDYFKKEAITWAWEFLTEHLKLEPDRLWVTVFEDDDEAYAIWRDLVGVPEERIGRFGEDENYWPGGAITHGPNGPSGPCSEIFYDRGPGFGTPDETGPNTGSGDRFVEIWNLVFTQYDRQGPIPGPGILKPLPQKNIDTGMGLYRVAAILQGVEDFYRTDTFFPLIERVALWSGRPYEGKSSVSHRVIADHVRAVVAALSDGATFSNTGRGYVVRRLLRRALRHGYLLGLKDPFLHRLAPVVAELLGDFYPEMRENLPAVEKQIRLEEERFLETLEGGVRRLEELLSGLKPGEALPGEEAFRLYDTYGFPLDLTVEIAAERGFGVDTEGFEEAMRLQQERSRAAMAFEREIFKRGAQVLEEIQKERGGTEFVGYTDLEAEAEVLALLAGDQSLLEAGPGTEVQVVLDRTPFYAEGGGQIGDFGFLEWPGGRARVETTRKTEGGIFLHKARVEEGTLRVGQRVRAVVDPRRRDTERNHTATHLLHAALRAVLGPHVRQAGSLVAPDRLRFDFTHPEPLSLEELERVERLVNRWIMADLPVRWTYKPLEEAKKEGAMALFGEKYGEVVRVVEVAEASKELCGGTHVRRTGEIGAFFIAREEAVSAGVRRVEALTGEGALDFVQGMRRRLHRLAEALGTGEAALEERISRLKEELKAKEKEAALLKARLARAELKGEVEEKGGLRYTVQTLSGLDASALRQAADDLVAQGVDVVLLFSEGNAVLKLSKKALERGLEAGSLMRRLTERAGGRGGGKGALAQGGGLLPERAKEALLEAL
ncbi:alanine--tRNA ligase [Thermus filiformis]|uniref:Alanine--tRNA ligase n=1 Tax=Thermus filiformis TaxID=276 RepID=A0A0D6XAU9_THEFI|nr:alanine--tRNA ligase [Thermus filiformis]KIX84822.1 alanyl-tRNA synthetase [Thermus filiformis]